MKGDKEKQYFSTSEVAEHLNISRIAVFKKIKEGKIRAQKIGRNYAIAREDLLTAIGEELSPAQKSQIEKAVNKAAEQYRETFERLAKE